MGIVLALLQKFGDHILLWLTTDSLLLCVVSKKFFATEPSLVNGPAHAAHHLTHQLEPGREQQLPGVLRVGGLLEPGVQPFGMESALKEGTPQG